MRLQMPSGGSLIMEEMDDELAELIGMHEEPGIMGTFTRKSVPWAEPNGARLVKVNSEPGDAHRDGEVCTVLGSFGTEILWAYFVAWENEPNVARFTVGWKLRKP